MRVPEEPVCIHLYRQNLVFTSLHLRSPVHVVPPQEDGAVIAEGEVRAKKDDIKKASLIYSCYDAPSVL